MCPQAQARTRPRSFLGKTCPHTTFNTRDVSALCHGRARGDFCQIALLIARYQGAQCSLAKVASGSAVAERTYISRIECGRWASLPVEASQLRACPYPRTRGGYGPAPGGELVPSPLRGPDSIWGSGAR